MSGSSSHEGGDDSDFIEKELLPEVDRRWRGGKPRTLVGHSSGGVIVTWADGESHESMFLPVTRERFDAAVARLGVRLPLREQSAQARALPVDMERERGFLRRLVARRGGRHYFAPAGDIDWLEADGNYLHVHASGRTHLVRYTVKDVEARLDPDRFVRIHRSTIVAIDRVGSIQTAEHGEWVITMPDGAKLRSSRSYAARVRALLR